MEIGALRSSLGLLLRPGAACRQGGSSASVQVQRAETVVVIVAGRSPRESCEEPRRAARSLGERSHSESPRELRGASERSYSGREALRGASGSALIVDDTSI